MTEVLIAAFVGALIFLMGVIAGFSTAVAIANSRRIAPEDEEDYEDG